MPADTTPRRNWAVPAGEILAEALEERGWSQAELARRTDRPLKTINEIVKGKAGITPDTAIQLERVMGIAAHVWLNLERAYGEWQARNRDTASLDKSVEWARLFPVEDLVRYRVIKKPASKADALAALLEYFEVATQSAWERHWQATPVALRASSAFEARLEPLAAWLRWGEIQAKAIECASFDAVALSQALLASRAFSRLDPIAFQRRLETQLCAVGVVLVMLPELSGTHVSGAARWLSADKALVQLSLRHKSDDQFWFTLFHECAHLLRGKRRTTYVDATLDTHSNNDDEVAADELASDLLVPNVPYESFVARHAFTRAAIEDFAKSLNVSPGVVVGRLQHDGHVSRSSQLNHLKKKMQF